MDDIIKDFHDLAEIPPFQETIPDKKIYGHGRTSGCITDEYRA